MTTLKSTEDCKEAGKLIPVIDRNRCEGKADCVAVCPYDVFEIRKLDQADKEQFSLVGRFKLAVHGNKQAFAIRATDCHACGLCVQACPEKAIKLVRPAN